MQYSTTFTVRGAHGSTVQSIRHAIGELPPNISILPVTGETALFMVHLPRHGSTSDISLRIAEELEGAGFEVREEMEGTSEAQMF